MILFCLAGLLALDAPLATFPLQCSGHACCVIQEKHTLILYYSSHCPYSRKVLGYLQTAHRKIPMKNVDDNPQWKTELKEMGGKLQVPCLLIDCQPLYESDEIIDWLKKNPPCPGKSGQPDFPEH